jgi:hypothetical protein
MTRRYNTGRAIRPLKSRFQFSNVLFELFGRMAAAATPPSPVMDAPTPPRPAVLSGDTKTFDRGRRRAHTHTHTHTFVAFLFVEWAGIILTVEVVSIVRLTIKRINKAYHTHTDTPPSQDRRPPCLAPCCPCLLLAVAAQPPQDSCQPAAADGRVRPPQPSLLGAVAAISFNPLCTGTIRYGRHLCAPSRPVHSLSRRCLASLLPDPPCRAPAVPAVRR